MAMVQFLKFIGFAAIMLAIVPLAGLCATGSWRAAWRYTRIWLAVVGSLAGIGFVLFGIMWAIIPAP